MKSRACLILMEQLIMVMVFALAAALCLQVFVKADKISSETHRLDMAVTIAQNAAELLKSGVSENDIPRDGEYPLDITREDTGIPGFARANIAVYHAEAAQPLFALTVGWQEAAG